MKTATKPAEAAVNLGVEILVPTNLIDPSPFQTRKRFDQESLNALAASLRDHGQLQNLIVRQTGDRYELIAGERRWRAGQIAKLEMMRCLVIEADDNAARELVIIENLERENVSAIEEAAGFQQLIESGQYSQKTLAERLHRDPSFISNRLRLLSLPEEWRSQLIEGGLLPTQARLLVPWADRPAVLEQVKARFANMIAVGHDDLDDVEDEDDNEDETPRRIIDISCEQVQEIVNNSAKSLSRSMRVGYWDGPKFEVTDELLQQLDVAEVSGYDGKHLRAFNVELWERLQEEALQKLQGKRKSQFDPDDLEDDLDTEDTEDTEDAEESIGRTSRLQDYHLARYMSKHVSSVIAGHIKADNIGLRTFLMIMADDGYAFMRWVGESQGINDNEILKDETAWNALATITQKNFGTEMATFLRERLANIEKGQLLNLEQMLLVCRDSKLDPVAHWTPDAELLELCSDDQLREMLIDHVAPEKQVKKWKRARMLKEAVEGWPAGYLPILLKPKVMIEFGQKTGS